MTAALRLVESGAPSVHLAAARWPRGDRSRERLMLVDRAAGLVSDHHVGDLAALVAPGDVVVLNDAATIPASLAVRTARGESLEVRLAGHVERTRWRAVLLGAGDWRTPTEHRSAPPDVPVGAILRTWRGHEIRVASVASETRRLVEIDFVADAGARSPGGGPLGDVETMWRTIYEEGRAIQYAHVAAPLELWHAQTSFATRPWAVEQPCAGRPISFALLTELRRRGASIATVTHAAGLSATGDPIVDAMLPLPERFEVPRRTADLLRAAHTRGADVIAVGTTVVRALEGAAELAAARGAPRGELAASGETDVLIGPERPPRVATALMTGFHEPGESHFTLMTAFAPAAILERAIERAAAHGYLRHEFGDSLLLR